MPDGHGGKPGGKATAFSVLAHDDDPAAYPDDRSWNNWLIWVVGIAVSMIPLLASPIGRAFALGWHSEWFSDVFSDPGVLMVSVSMSVAVIFELNARRNNEASLLRYKAAIIVIAAFAFLFYSLDRGISSYGEHMGHEAPDRGRAMAIIGALLLTFVFYSGTCFFIPDRMKALRGRIMACISRRFVKQR